MSHPIHALDSFFYTSMGVYAFQSQCEMLAELGYDGITVAAWGGTPYTDLSLLPGVKARHGPDVTSLYLVLHAGRNDAALHRIVETVEGVELIELAIQTTRNGTDGILRSIESLLPIIERRGLRLALYPHLKHVNETTTQVQRLEAIKPWLMQVVLSGSTLSPLGWGGVATMEPVDRGELDNFAVVAALNRIGYAGSLGILGWDYGGDIYLKLERCLATVRGIDRRLQTDPI